VLVQQGITRTADVGAEARQQRVVGLRASIAALRATAEELRNAAAASSQSKVLASRQSAAESLSAALETERLVQARTAELAELQAAQRPTTTQILGEGSACALGCATAASCPASAACRRRCAAARRGCGATWRSWRPRG
jgi:hypothetical protein